MKSGEKGLSYFQPRLFSGVHALELTLKSWATYAGIPFERKHDDIILLLDALQSVASHRLMSSLIEMRHFIEFETYRDGKYVSVDRVYTKIRYEELQRYSGSALSELVIACVVVVDWIEETYQEDDRWVLREVPRIWPESVVKLSAFGVEFTKQT